MNHAKKHLEGKDRCRILTLDGGGVRGALTAWTLENMERYLNEKDGSGDLPLGRRFDLIAGTSVGAILALSLALGKSAAEIVQHWVGKEEDVRDRETAVSEGRIGRIFGRPKSLPCWLCFVPKHDSKALKEELNSWFGEKTLNDIVKGSGESPHVLVTSTALAKPSLRTWKSPWKDELKARSDKKLADVAYASAAAPIFFASQTNSGFDAPLADGGLCANNPVMTAIVEAIEMGASFEQIRLVSVGTGIPCGMPYDPGKVGQGGAMRWFLKLWTSPSFIPSPAIPLIELMIEAQSDMAHHQANFLVGQERYLRINPQLKFPMKLDEIEKIGYLKAYSDLTKGEYQKLANLVLA